MCDYPNIPSLHCFEFFFFAMNNLLSETPFHLTVSICSGNIAGKASHGNELYACVWVCRSFFEVTLEVWAFGASITYSSIFPIPLMI